MPGHWTAAAEPVSAVLHRGQSVREEDILDKLSAGPSMDLPPLQQQQQPQILDLTDEFPNSLPPDSLNPGPPCQLAVVQQHMGMLDILLACACVCANHFLAIQRSLCQAWSSSLPSSRPTSEPAAKHALVVKHAAVQSLLQQGVGFRVERLSYARQPIIAHCRRAH